MTQDKQSLLRVTGLGRAFGEGELRRQVLAGVDLEVARGERLALLGESGSGKSTLLNLVAGIDVADHGTIELEGQIVGSLSERALTLYRRRHIGFIYQFFNLVPALNVADNVALPLELNGWSETAITDRVSGILDQVGLAGREDDFPDRLSGGEQQRVAIARGLVHEPSLVLADEPTGNLDAKSGRAVLDLLNDMARKSGQTLIVATHSREVARSADRVVSFRGGQLADVDAGTTW